MLVDVHRELSDWLGELAAASNDLALIDGTEDATDAVRVRLGAIARSNPLESTRRPDATPLVLRYVVSVHSRALNSLEFLERLLIDVRVRVGMHLRLDLEPFELVPRLEPGEVGVVIDVVGSARSSTPDAVMVTKPIVITTEGLLAFSGVVQGRGIPLPGAAVVLSSVGGAVRTNAKGEFVFGAVPANPRIQQLSVKVKGRTFNTEADVTSVEPIVIDCDL